MLVRCTEGFTTATVRNRKGEVTQRSFTIKGGMVLDADNEIVRAYADHFAEAVDEVVERATAAPGEVRRTTRAKVITAPGKKGIKAKGKKAAKAEAPAPEPAPPAPAAGGDADTTGGE